MKAALFCLVCLLIAGAKCYSKCIAPGDQLPVLIYLADAIANP